MTTSSRSRAGAPGDLVRRQRLAHALTLSDAGLLRECEVDAFLGSGPGGQHRNKVESAVRLLHRPSGLTACARERRSQHQNKRAALERLRRKILDALQVPETRIPTRPTRAAVRRRLEQKRRLATKKQSRQMRFEAPDD